MKRSLLTAATLALLAGTTLPAYAQVPAQTPGQTKAGTQGVGIQMSWLSGSGFAYRRWLDNGWGFQVAAFPLVLTDYYFFNPGGQVMKELFRNGNLRAYALSGVGAAMYGSTYGASGMDLGIPVGGGVDWFWGENLSINFGLGYTLSFHSNRRSPTLEPGGTVGVMLEW